MNFSCVYAITNKVNGKRYIGSAVNWRTRKTAHLRCLRSDKHHSTPLQRAWRKYGEEAFDFTPLFICARQDLLFYEQRAIDAFDSYRCGYNATKAAGSQLGMKRTPEQRARLSAANMARWARYTPEEREAIAAKQRGRQWTDEAKAKISKAHKGRKHSGAALENIRAARPVGRITPLEQRQKISAALKGRPKSEQHRINAGNALKGRTFSEETRAKMSASARARRRIITTQGGGLAI